MLGLYNKIFVIGKGFVVVHVSTRFFCVFTNSAYRRCIGGITKFKIVKSMDLNIFLQL